MGLMIASGAGGLSYPAVPRSINVTASHHSFSGHITDTGISMEEPTVCPHNGNFTRSNGCST